MELHQNVDKFLHLREKVVENSRLAPQFLPSPRPNLPAITDSPEGGGAIYWSLRYVVEYNLVQHYNCSPQKTIWAQTTKFPVVDSAATILTFSADQSQYDDYKKHGK